VRGDTRDAIALSCQLEEEYPTSREAVTSRLSLGMLYLQDRQPVAALEQFRGFRRVGSGATVPEAIWGESQALRQLGRAAEERATLEELLQAYPESAYAAAVRKRLADLR
jgi:TolA-binding protein